MAGVAIMGSLCTGHAGYIPRPSVEGELKFIVNGKPVMTTGKAFAPHIRPLSPPHAGVVIGTSKLLVNGLPVAKIGDLVSCGSLVLTGEMKLQVT